MSKRTCLPRYDRCSIRFWAGKSLYNLNASLNNASFSTFLLPTSLLIVFSLIPLWISFEFFFFRGLISLPFSNMDVPVIQLHVDTRRLSRSERFTNSVVVIFNTISNEILEDPTAGYRTITGRSNPVSPPLRFNSNLRSPSRRHIRVL